MKLKLLLLLFVFSVSLSLCACAPESFCEQRKYSVPDVWYCWGCDGLFVPDRSCCDSCVFSHVQCSELIVFGTGWVCAVLMWADASLGFTLHCFLLKGKCIFLLHFSCYFWNLSDLTKLVKKFHMETAIPCTGFDFPFAGLSRVFLVNHVALDENLEQ